MGRREKLVFLFGVLTIIIVALSLYKHDEAIKESAFEARELRNLQSINIGVLHQLSMVISDMHILASRSEVLLKIDKTEMPDKTEISSLFADFIIEKKAYDNIRFIDKTGMELVRVDKTDDGTALLVPDDDLQDESGRYYFRDTMATAKGNIYVSRFDLNTEHGQVEIPYKPVIRYGMAVRGADGNVAGIIVLNYLGHKLLADVERMAASQPFHLRLTDDNGYYLLHEDEEKTWGFMFPDRKNANFAMEYPHIWEQILGKDSGHLDIGGNVYTFTTIYPYGRMGSLDHSNGDATYFQTTERGAGYSSYWKLISFAPKSTIYGERDTELKKIAFIYIVMILALGLISFRIGMVKAEEPKRITDFLSPWFIVLTMGTVIFLSEILVMLLLSLFSDISPTTGAIISAAMVFILTTPALYLLVFKPLVLYDVSRRRQEENLRKSKETAEKATKLKDTFVSLVAHDLRSPLTSIVGLVRMIDADSSGMDARCREMIKRIITTSEHMVEMIASVLNLSRLQSGSISPKKQFFDAHFAVVVSLGSISHLAAKKGIELVNDVPVGTRLYADPVLFGEVMLNLSSNAVKFCSEGDQILVSLSTSPEGTLMVQDSGSGIREEMKENLFESEIKTSSLGTAGEVGTGLGLPYCHEIMKSLDGDIWFETQTGKGTTFHLFIPEQHPVILLDIADKKYLKQVSAIVAEAGIAISPLSTCNNKVPDMLICEITEQTEADLLKLKKICESATLKQTPVICIADDPIEGIEKYMGERKSNRFMVKDQLVNALAGILKKSFG